MARFRTPPPSPKNLQLSICTPPTFQMSFEWPLSLPWLSLREAFWNIHQRDEASIALSLMMGVLVPESGENLSISISKLIEGASNVMPEWYPGEHVKAAQDLLTGPTSERLSECFKFMVYMLSNSMVTELDGRLDFYTSMMEIGIIDFRADLKKLLNESSSFQAFVEKLFQLEIQDATSRASHNTEIPRPLHLITWLLELGQDPNYHCQVALPETIILATPIQKATYAGHLELVELLLRFRARPDIPQRSGHREAFVNLALASSCSDGRKLRVLNLLFDHKFLSMDEMLRAAIELRDESLMCKMLQCGTDATSYETSWLDPQRRQKQYVYFGRTHFTNPSALMMAVQAGGKMADLMLHYLLLKDQPAPSILVDACIAAAYGGDHATVARLDEMHGSGKVCNAHGITPLQAGVVGGNPAVCRYLLKRYGGASSSLAFVAAFLVNVEVLQLLIDYGADPNAQASSHDTALNDYLNIPRPSYWRSSATILTILIESGFEYNFREESIITLIQNGAIPSYKDVAKLSRRRLHRALKEALSAGGNPNDDDGHGSTALQCATACYPYDEDEGQTDSSSFFDEDDQNDGCLSFDNKDKRVARRLTVMVLIQAGANMIGGEVVRAIYLRDKSLLMFLLQHGGTLTDIDDTGRGCLEAEIEAHNNISLQEVLEKQEIGIDAGPFCAAIQRKDWDLVERLFTRAHQSTPCHLLEGTAVGLAAEAGQLTILERLLSRFTHHSVLSSAILPISILTGNIKGYDEYRRNDIEIHVYDEHRDRQGFWRIPPEGGYFHIKGSLLTLAALAQDTTCFRELLRRGCYMDTIAWSIVAKSERSSYYLPLLREFGAGLGTTTTHEIELKTALCESIDVGNHAVARYLVEVGADVNEFDIHVPIFETGKRLSPLQLATKKNDIDMALYLLESGAMVNAPPSFCQGATALQFASIGGYIGFARHLLQLGARVNARGSPLLGRSALEGAAEHGRLDMLALLIHHGAVTTGCGRQQLIKSVAFAQARAHITVAEWLKKNCGWSDDDQHHLEFVDADANYPVEECIIAYCCDEYHDSDTQCVYHYTEEQRRHHYQTCETCWELEAEAGKVRAIGDDGNESRFLSEDEDSDSEGNED
ncbi:Sex-determining fem-1 [Fusarium acutatum]|uniref:Sex-determining fem-1 n=1 Tax=Fusarium acutatum TaxID=78861 RepID=A0A8H4K849_9HYPO|nr:Sex-determining fem-1 [Fusarium acutatum]